MIRLLFITLATVTAIHLLSESLRASVILVDLNDAAMVRDVAESSPAPLKLEGFEPTDQAGMCSTSVSVNSISILYVANLGPVAISSDTSGVKLMYREIALHIAPFLQKRLRPPCCASELEI